MIPYHYAPIRACVGGPRSDSRTIAVLLVPLDGAPVVARRTLPPARAALSRVLDDLLAAADRAAAAEAAEPGALIRWWEARAACRTDSVYLAEPMSGITADPSAEVAAILAEKGME